MGILLKDILGFDNLRENNNTIRLRFNNDWTISETKKRFIYSEYYLSSKTEDKLTLENNLLTYKGHRMYSGEIVFQFIELENNQWLLIDVIKVLNIENCKIDNRAEVKHMDEYEPFIDRIIVNKPKNRSEKTMRTWTTNNPELVNSTEIVEILKDKYKKIYSDFSGYENISKTYEELYNVIDEPIWKKALSSVYGVYVITNTDKNNKDAGYLYIGSATGEKGIYGRWKTYLERGYADDEVEDRDYPNKRLKEIANKEGLEYIRKNFKYSILEIFTKNKIGKEKALEREKYWKKVFETKTHGYNDN